MNDWIINYFELTWIAFELGIYSIINKDDEINGWDCNWLEVFIWRTNNSDIWFNSLLICWWAIIHFHSYTQTLAFYSKAIISKYYNRLANTPTIILIVATTKQRHQPLAITWTTRVRMLIIPKLIAKGFCCVLFKLSWTLTNKNIIQILSPS